MPRLFVSYARADAAFVRTLVGALEAAGHRVWWDALLPGGTRFRETIEQQIDEADVVLVLWSGAGRSSRYVLDEAERAARCGTLLSLMRGGEAPLGFGAVQGLDVSGWDGEPDGPAWQRLQDGIAQVAATLCGRAADVAPAAPAWRVAAPLALALGSSLGTALWAAPPAAGVRSTEALLLWPWLDAWALGLVAAWPAALLGARESAARGLPGWRPAMRRTLTWYTRAALAALAVTALSALGGAFDRTAGLIELVRAALLLTMTFAALAALVLLVWRGMRRLLSGTAPRR